MELPQPRAFGNEGGRPLRDFLSLYSQSAVQQDPTRQHQGNFPKTHDFFQPLEPATKAGGKVERAVETTEKTPPLSPPPPGQHLLPGGIGTYSIRHAATYFNPKAPKTEATRFSLAQSSSPDRNEENSYCDSYTGSGFTLWEESAMRKGEWGEEETPISTSEPSANIAQRTSELSPSNHHSCNSLSCYQRPSAHKKQSFLEAVKSPRSNGEDEEDDEEDFVQKKEGFIYEGKLHAVVDRKSIGQKPNTARSKHSATEQRRRSKINERFQMLRELIPHRDQKRDKASFLLEVIEYIQFLQEKVHGYEGSPQGWDHESAKLMALRNGHRPAKRIIDHSQAISCSSGQPLLFATKIEEDNIIASPSIPLSVPSNPLESDLSKATTFRAMDNHSMPPQRPIFSNLTSVLDNTLFKPPSQLLQTRPGDKPNDRDLAIEAGTVSISSLYSQGLLSTLTQALQNSGVDLSQASISVQIDLAKQLNNRPIAPTSILKEEEVPLSNQPCSRTEVGSGADRYDQAFKRLKRSEC